MSRRMNLAQERDAWARFFETGEVSAGAGNKFNAVRTESNGRTFDSGEEAKRAVELQWLLHLGKISDLRYQVKFVIIPKQEGESEAEYVADFTYKDENGNYIVEDSKGHRTAEYRLKRKLMLLVHGIRILETGKKKTKRPKLRYIKPPSKSR
jgi:hypothetical protein